jgi:hypothetical protein
MARKKSNQPNVGAWLGGNKGYLRSGEQSDQTSAKVDAGGGQMDAVRRELGLGAYAAGIGTTAAIGAGVAAVRSGRVVNPVAAARNLAKGEKVVVHGTPHQLQGKFIEPRAESWGAQDVGKPIAYYFDPRATNAKNKLPRGVQEYSNPSLYFNPDLKSRMNAVIGTTPKSATKVHKTTGYSYSEAPISIQKVVKTNKSPEQLGKELQRELRKLGTQMRGEPMVDKVKTALIRHQNKKMRNWRQ